MEIFFFTDKWMDENGHQYVLQSLESYTQDFKIYTVTT